MADGLSGLASALSRVYPTTPLQRCVTHLKRNMLNQVRHGDKQELSQDLAFVFVLVSLTIQGNRPGPGGKDSVVNGPPITEV